MLVRDVLPVLAKVAIPIITFCLGRLFPGKRARQAVLRQRRAEEEVDAYDRVVGDFKLLQQNAADQLRTWEPRMEAEIPWTAEERFREEQMAGASRVAYDRLRAAVVEPVEVLQRAELDVV